MFFEAGPREDPRRKPRVKTAVENVGNGKDEVDLELKGRTVWRTEWVAES